MSAKTSLIAVTLVSASCHVPPPTLPLDSWKAPVETEHPLVGKLYDARSGELIAVDQLRERVRYSQFVLVGEKHDNPDHHRVQAAVIATLVGDGGRPALVAEMISTDQQGLVDRAIARDGADADDLAKALAWDQSGWPEFDIYRPVFATTLAAGLPVVGGNLPKEEATALAHGGEAAAAERALLAESLGDEARARLIQMLAESHCGHAPASRLEAMIRVQRARDARLGATMAKRGAERGAVLIAGLEHVRRDYGVPWYLERLVPGATVTVVAPVEVSAEGLEPRDYLRGAGEPIFDLIYFTPRVDSDDPCERFRDKLEKLRAQRQPTAKLCPRPRAAPVVEL